MSARRSETEVVADTMVWLAAQGYMSGLEIWPAAKRLGLTQTDVAHAQDRWKAREGEPPRPAGRSAEKKSAAPKQKDRFRVNPKTGAKEAWCTGARVHAPHWGPVKDFAERSDRPGEIRSACRPAMKAYQRQYTTAAQAMPFINQLGITLEVDEDSVVIGLKCSSCKVPFEAGDSVKMHGSPHHEGCLQEALG